MCPVRIMFAIGTLVFLISACSSSEQTEQPEQPEQPAQETAPQTSAQPPMETPEQPAPSGQTDSPTSDTVAASAASSQPAPSPRVTLGPGMVRVSATIVSSEPQGSAHTCVVKIQKVHGYGASTPPLAVGNELKVSVKNAQVEMAGEKGQKLLLDGSVVEVSIRYQQPMAAIQPPPPSWSVMEIH